MNTIDLHINIHMMRYSDFVWIGLHNSWLMVHAIPCFLTIEILKYKICVHSNSICVWHSTYITKYIIYLMGCVNNIATNQEQEVKILGEIAYFYTFVTATWI